MKMPENEEDTHKEHDVPAGGFFTPPLYLQRYDFVKKLIESQNAQTIVDLGCAECKFVLEAAQGPVRRVIGVDMDPDLLSNSSHRFTTRFDNNYNGRYKRKNDLVIELLSGDVTSPCDDRLKGAEFVSCIELIEHINPEDHPGLVKTIFGSIQPKMAVITTPNGEFNDYWATMPHGKYRHPDHRFEWTRNEFKTFVESVLELYPEYSVTYDGIGVHWGGGTSKGKCSQAAIFTRKADCPRPEMNYEKEIDLGSFQWASTDKGPWKCKHAIKIPKYCFKSRLFEGIERAMDPYIGIKQDRNDDVELENDEIRSIGVFVNDSRYYHKPDIRSEVEKFLKVAPVNKLAGKYAGIILPSRGYQEPKGVALTNKEKYSFNSNTYSHTNLISIEDEDAGFDSEESFNSSSPPAREMNMDWNGWGDFGGQDDHASNENGWSQRNRPKSKSQSSDSDLYARSARAKKKISKRTQPGQFEDVDEELFSNAAKRRKIEDSSKVFRGLAEDLPELPPKKYKPKEIFELELICNFYTVYGVLEEDGHKERVSKELVMLQQLLASEDYLVFKTNENEPLDVLITRYKPEINVSSRGNSDSEENEPERPEYNLDSDGSEW